MDDITFSSETGFNLVSALKLDRCGVDRFIPGKWCCAGNSCNKHWVGYKWVGILDFRRSKIGVDFPSFLWITPLVFKHLVYAWIKFWNIRIILLHIQFYFHNESCKA